MCCLKRSKRFLVIMVVLACLMRERTVLAVEDSECSDTMRQARQSRRSSVGRLFPRFLKQAISDATRPISHVWDKGQTGGSSQSPNLQDEESSLDYQKEFIDEVEGARLLSVSLQVISTTFGLLADNIRISGETMAGVVGSSVKLTGTAIKTVSAGFGAASSALDPEQKQQHHSATDQWGKLSSTPRRRKELTSERMNDAHYGSREYDFRVVRNAKKVAAKSIRLVGSVIDGVGESLLLAGAATEYLASTSVGVAEGTVRIVEDFAGVLSTTLSPDYDRRASKPTHDSFTSNLRDSLFHRNRTYVNFGSRGGGNRNAGSSHSERSSEETMVSFPLDLLNYLRIQLSEFPAFLFADTGGTPSLAPEFLLLFAFCYVATVLTMWCSQARGIKKSKIRTVPSGSTLIIRLCSKEHQHELVKLPSSATIDRMPGLSSSDDKNESKGRLFNHHNRISVFATVQRILARLRPLVLGSLLLAWTAACGFFSISRCFLFLFFRITFHRWTVIFGIYSFAWVYICRACQLRAHSIQRNAESVGFRSAIDSIGISTEPLPESALWLNAVLSQVWRVPLESSTSNIPSPHVSAFVEYPRFVTRAMEPCYLGTCPGRVRGKKSIFLPPYGGLEPYIASHLGTSIMRTLDLTLTSRPKDVAYISMRSFTLGSHPPIIKTVQLLGVDKSEKHGSRLHMSVEADVQLEDFSLVLEVKLSSLQYSMLPSTRIAVHALSARIRLNMHLTFTPEFPFVSTIEFSLEEAPEINLRITPLDDGSGLRGVDVGSLPLIRAWVQDAVRETLSEYVTPKYVSVDMIALLATSWQGNHCDPTVPDATIDIGRLRRSTGHDITTNPRTSTPEGIAVASVGTKLSSRDSAMRVVGWKSRRRKNGKLRPALVVRPTTELSRLAMERWLQSNNNMQEVTEPSSTKVSTVVSYPWRKIHRIGRSLTKFLTPPRWIERKNLGDVRR